MYEINYIDQQFFIITKPQDNNSLNWPVGSGHSHIDCKYTFLSFLKKLSALTTGMEEGLGGGGGGGSMQIKWAIYIYIYIYIYILTLLINIMLTLLINIMLTDFHHLLIL